MAPGRILIGSPLERLSAWHRLGERQFEVLRWLQEREGAPQRAERDAALAVLRYFDLSVAVHHRDEEDDLYPALIESMAGSDAVCLRELVQAAAASHRAIESAWQAVRPALLALSRGEPATLAAVAVEALVQCARDEFEREDKELIPMAERLLDEAALVRLRESFDERHYNRRPDTGAR